MLINQIKLSDIAGGGFQEQFQKSFEAIIKNLKDPNTSFKEKRKLVVELTFEQDENREEVAVQMKFKEKLAPRMPLKTMYSIGQDLGTGKVEAVEFGIGSIPGQMRLSDYVAEQTIDGKIIDTDTGEIVGETTPIDLRKEGLR